MNPYVRTRALSRRAVLAGAGLAGLAVAGLSGCGSEAEAPAGSAPSAGGAGLTVPTSDIPVGGGKIFGDAGAVVTQPTQGEFKAFSNICTHQNCPVTEIAATINCTCHGSAFALADGSVVRGPADEPLGAKTVRVEGGSLTVT